MMMGNGGPIIGCLSHRVQRVDECLWKIRILPSQSFVIIQTGLWYEFSTFVLTAAQEVTGQRKCHHSQCAWWLISIFRIQNNSCPVTRPVSNCICCYRFIVQKELTRISVSLVFFCLSLLSDYVLYQQSPIPSICGSCSPIFSYYC